PDAGTFAYGAGSWIPLAGNWDGNAGSRVSAGSVIPGASGADVTLSAGGLLTIATGGGTGITATGATIDLLTSGAVETPGSVLTAANLRLRGVGAFDLGQANRIDTLAAGTAGGPLGFNDANNLTVGSVLGVNGIGTSGPLVVGSAGSLTVTQPVT